MEKIDKTKKVKKIKRIKKMKGGSFLKDPMIIPRYLYNRTQNAHNMGREFMGQWVFNPLSNSWEFLQGGALRMYNLFSNKDQRNSQMSHNNNQSRRSFHNMRLRHELPERTIRNRMFSYTNNELSKTPQSNISNLSSHSESGNIHSNLEEISEANLIENSKNKSRRNRLDRVTEGKIRKTTTLYRLIIIFTPVLSDPDLTQLNNILSRYHTDYTMIYRALTYLLNKISHKLNLYKKDKSVNSSSRSRASSLSIIENDLIRVISEMSMPTIGSKIKFDKSDIYIKELEEIVSKYYLYIMTYS